MYPLKDNYVTCAYGVPGSWMAGRHTGIDFRAAVGTRVHSCLPGRVVYAGEGAGGGPAYGKHVIIESTLNGRTVRMLYAHLSTIAVKAGAFVQAGEKIGRTGETGNTKGPHLHLELRHAPFDYWSFEDPAPALELVPEAVARRRRLRRVIRRLERLKARLSGKGGAR